MHWYHLVAMWVEVLFQHFTGATIRGLPLWQLCQSGILYWDLLYNLRLKNKQIVITESSMEFPSSNSLRKSCRKKLTLTSQQRSNVINSLIITGFLDFIHRPKFQITRKLNVLETESVSVFRWRERDTYLVASLEQWLRLVLSMRPNRIGGCLP
jgi:hypothetical protein